jgi:hypothetical protein
MAEVRRALTWLLALPLIVVGSQVAHGLAYWWAYPFADVRLAILEHTGHGYLAYLPILIAFLGGLELLVLLVMVVDRCRGNVGRDLPPWVFLWLPVVGFVLQEHLERLLASGVFPWWAVEQPTFWRGLVLQVPLGVAAYVIARFLRRAVEAVADIVVRRREARARPASGERGFRWSPGVAPLRATPLAVGAAGRAPPSLPR